MSTNDSNMFRSQVVWYLSQIIQDPPMVLIKGWLKILRSKNSKETQAQKKGVVAFAKKRDTLRTIVF